MENSSWASRSSVQVSCSAQHDSCPSSFQHCLQVLLPAAFMTPQAEKKRQEHCGSQHLQKLRGGGRHWWFTIGAERPPLPPKLMCTGASCLCVPAFYPLSFSHLQPHHQPWQPCPVTKITFSTWHNQRAFDIPLWRFMSASWGHSALSDGQPCLLTPQLFLIGSECSKRNCKMLQDRKAPRGPNLRAKAVAFPIKQTLNQHTGSCLEE